MKIVIVTIKNVHLANAETMRKYFTNMLVISDKEFLTYKTLKEYNPNYVFFIHWSWYIPKEIYDNFHCILFHCANLPQGRGGSPIQNQILDGIINTKICAIKVVKDVDAGSIYLTEYICLHGTLDEIFIRISNIIFEKMIPKIINETLAAIDQYGEPTIYKRRTDNEIKKSFRLKKIYDFIRMLDGEDYPKAYIQYGPYKIEFKRASLKHDHIIADVKIRRNDNV